MKPHTAKEVEGEQEVLPEIKCRACLDTGMIEVGLGSVKYCWCVAGWAAATDDLEAGVPQCSMCGDTGLLGEYAYCSCKTGQEKLREKHLGRMNDE